MSLCFSHTPATASLAEVQDR